MVCKLLISVTTLLLSIECRALYIGQSCTAEGQDGSCQLLPECQPLMTEIQQAGSPIPRHLTRRLNALNCGFQASQPLVCCPALTNVNNRHSGKKPSCHTAGASGNDDRMDDTNGPARPVAHPTEGSWHTRPSSNTHVPSWERPQTENPWDSNTHQNPPTWGASGNGENNDNDIFNNNDKKCNTDDDDTDDDRSTPPDIRGHRNLRILPKRCGTIEEDRIIGGNRTNLFEMPWMVLISYDSPRGRKLSCGGTLITKWYVLTAAHCVTSLGAKLSLSGVVLGEHDIRTDPDCEWLEGDRTCAPNARNFTIDTVIAHPGYSPQNLFDDIALLKLSEPADLSLANMMPICLPVTAELQSENLVNVNAIVAGWGATEDGLLQSPVLLNVKLPVISNEDCKAYFKGSPRINNKQLCAGGVGHKDSCGGDSGGPLMYPGQVGDAGVSYVQRGIVSFGSKRCGVEGYPGIYTRVAFYMDWILDNIAD